MSNSSHKTCMLQAAMEFDYVILEGNMITEIQEAMDLCDRIIFLMINQVFVVNLMRI